MTQTCKDHQHEWIVKADSWDKKYFECEWCDAEMWELKTAKQTEPEKLQEIEEVVVSISTPNQELNEMFIYKLNELIKIVNQLVKERV